METIYKILYSVGGMAIILFTLYMAYLFSELKKLIYDKSLYQHEKEEIRKSLRFLILIPLVLIIFLVTMPLRYFLYYLGFFCLLALISFSFSKVKSADKSTNNSNSSGGIGSAVNQGR